MVRVRVRFRVRVRVRVRVRPGTPASFYDKVDWGVRAARGGDGAAPP